jgi:hypothetical protein
VKIYEEYRQLIIDGEGCELNLVGDIDCALMENHRVILKDFNFYCGCGTTIDESGLTLGKE